MRLATARAAARARLPSGRRKTRVVAEAEVTALTGYLREIKEVSPMLELELRAARRELASRGIERPA